jgi:hypothetical protein
MKKHASNVAIVGTIFVIAELVAAIVLAIQFESIWIFLCSAISIVVLAVFVFSYSALLSEMGDQSDMLRKILAQIDARSEEDQATVPAHPYESNPTVASTGNVTKAKNAVSVVPKADAADPDYIVCPACGKRQRSNRSVCLECGASFKA